MSNLTRSLRIVLADSNRTDRAGYQELLKRLGHQVVGVAEKGEQAVELCRATQPDLAITSIRMSGLDGIEISLAVNSERRTPFVLLRASEDSSILSRALCDHVMAMLEKPVKPADLGASVALAVLRFEQLVQHVEEAASLKQTLEDRKLIERAKGAIMKRVRVEEEEAFRRMRKLASDKNRKLVEIARMIQEAEESFQSLEGRPPSHER